ncbi:MFS transporter [Clostridium sp. YIM B02515]|uniref:MFS transporter n=1 Tax=Clostridium rhizosphaerae TaxID=2803861 RepID=A0ABS1TC39_9CLOT|nr:MFS transporter [Clostridium rhizosphaerae]MBL4936933.1 MFS transporter [Clostridium rhizosphaerae]
MNTSILKQRNFSTLMLGKITSYIGTEMQNFALSLYVFKITGSATKFASVLAITLVPKLILGPIAGVFVDWLDRKKILVYLDILAALVVGAYAAGFAITGGLSLASIYVLVTLLSLISLLFQPAIGAVIPSIVEKDKLVDANGINSFLISIGTFVSPVLAGILFGIYGLFLILIVDSISFIASAICEFIITIPKINKAPSEISFKSFFNDFSEGLKFVKSKKLILNILFLALFLNFAADPVFSVGLVYIAKKILFLSDFQYGTIQSGFVVAMMIAPFFCSGIAKKFELGKFLFLCFIVNSLIFALLAVVPAPFYLKLFNSNTVPYISIIVVTFMIGFVITIANITLNTVFQKEIPLDMLGRAGTLMSTVSMGAMPLGTMLFGFLFDKLPAYLCVLISAATMLIATIALRKGLYSANEKTAGNAAPEAVEI